MAWRTSAAGNYLIRTTSTPGATPFTVCFRVQLVTDRNVAGTMFSLFSSNGTVYQDVRVTSNGTTPELRTSSNNASSSANLTAGTWYHIAYVRSGQVRVNGQVLGEVDAGSTATFAPDGSHTWLVNPSTKEAASVLLLTGEPLREPVALGGPIGARPCRARRVLSRERAKAPIPAPPPPLSRACGGCSNL